MLPKQREPKKCAGKNKKNDPCTYKVSAKCGLMYCNKHHNQWRLHQYQVENRDPNAHLCTGRGTCDPDNPGIITILPGIYTNKSCEPCLAHTAELDRDKRDTVIAQNKKLIKSGSCMRICPDCPQNDNMHHLDEMGGQDNTSQYCKHHYRARQKIEKNRDRSNRDY
jgi:hypothetical protein